MMWELDGIATEMAVWKATVIWTNVSSGRLMETVSVVARDAAEASTMAAAHYEKSNDDNFDVLVSSVEFVAPLLREAKPDDRGAIKAELEAEVERRVQATKGRCRNCNYWARGNCGNPGVPCDETPGDFGCVEFIQAMQEVKRR